MALRMELGIPPACVLLRELTEEVRDLLFEQSSGQCETRPLFREPGLGMREAGTPLATRGSNADCPLPLLSWRLQERGQKPVRVRRQKRRGLPSQPGKRTPSRHREGTNLAFFLPTPGIEVFPIHSPLQILFPLSSYPIDSHPQLLPPKHQQLHQLPAGQSGVHLTKYLLKYII